MKRIEFRSRRKSCPIFRRFKGPTNSTVTSLFHKYKFIFILVPNNPTNLFQPLDISVIKGAECFLEDEYQNWCANEVLKQLARGVETCDVNVDIRLKNIKSLRAN